SSSRAWVLQKPRPRRTQRAADRRWPTGGSHASRASESIKNWEDTAGRRRAISTPSWRSCQPECARLLVPMSTPLLLHRRKCRKPVRGGLGNPVVATERQLDVGERTRGKAFEEGLLIQSGPDEH